MKKRQSENIARQDGVIFKRIKDRVERSMKKLKLGDKILYTEYLELMADLKYRNPGEEQLESESEKLWQLMVAAESSGLEVNPHNIDLYLSMDK